jgi:hypothetical protein
MQHKVMPPSFGPAALVTAEYHAPTGHADRPGVHIKPQQNYGVFTI